MSSIRPYRTIFTGGSLQRRRIGKKQSSQIPEDIVSQVKPTKDAQAMRAKLSAELFRTL